VSGTETGPDTGCSAPGSYIGLIPILIYSGWAATAAPAGKIHSFELNQPGAAS